MRVPAGSADTRGSSWPAVAVVVVVLLAAAAGSQPRERASIDARRFDAVFAMFQAHFLGERDERGLSWRHATYRAGGGPIQRSDLEIDYVRVGEGRDRATLVRERYGMPGYSRDVLHPSGSDRDFVLVGDNYRRPALPGEAGPKGPLVDTPWVSRPAKGPGGQWSPCITSATRAFCGFDAALPRSEAAVSELPRWVRDNADGTRTGITGIRLADLVAGENGPFLDTQLAVLAPSLGRLLPLEITVSASGEFLRAQINAQLTAPGVEVGIDIGLEHRGDASAADIPRAPADPAEVTVMDEFRYLRFGLDTNARAST